jgi:tetratricopeptide (TPR) repeat protein
LYSEGVLARYNARYADARKLFEDAVKLDPGFAMAHFRLFQVVRVWGEMDLSEAYGEKVRENMDRLPERQQLLVQAEFAEPDEALVILEETIARFPDEEEAYLLLSGLLMREFHEPEKLLDVMELAVSALPQSGHIRNQYGYALLNQGRYTEAIRELETYVRLSPKEPNAHDSLGEAYLVSGQPENALEQYARALEVNPSFGSSNIGRAWAFGMLGRYDETLMELAALEALGARASYTLGSVHFMQAFIYSRRGRYQAAEGYISRGLPLADAFDEVDGHLLAALLSFEREKYVDVLERVRRTQSAIPNAPSEGYKKRMTILALLLVGVAEAHRGELPPARAQLETQSRHYDPGDSLQRWWHQSLVGEIALTEGDLKAAEAAFLEGEPEIKMYMSISNPSISVFANNLPFRDGLARVKKARGDLDGAISIYRELNTPGLANRWTAMLEPRYILETARLLHQKGDTDAARAEYQRFLELWKDADPDLPELAEAQRYTGR